MSDFWTAALYALPGVVTAVGGLWLMRGKHKSEVRKDAEGSKGAEFTRKEESKGAEFDRLESLIEAYRVRADETEERAGRMQEEFRRQLSRVDKDRDECRRQLAKIEAREEVKDREMERMEEEIKRLREQVGLLQQRSDSDLDRTPDPDA